MAAGIPPPDRPLDTTPRELRKRQSLLQLPGLPRPPAPAPNPAKLEALQGRFKAIREKSVTDEEIRKWAQEGLLDNAPEDIMQRIRMAWFSSASPS